MYLIFLSSFPPLVLTTRLMSLAGRGSSSDVVQTSFRKLCSPSPLLIAFTRRPYSSSPVSGMLIILKSRAAADYRWTFTRRWSLHAKIQRGRRNKEKCYWPNTTFDVTTRRVCPCRQMSKWCYYYYGVISHRAPSLNSFLPSTTRVMCFETKRKPWNVAQKRQIVEDVSLIARTTSRNAQ